MKRLITAFATMVTVSALLAGAASAHARFQSSTPAPGSTVAAPAAITIMYTEDLASGSTGYVTNVSRDVVSTGSSISTTTRNQLTIALKPGLPAGGYTVYWHSISADDGDQLDGTFSFSIAAAAPAPGAVAAPAPGTAKVPAPSTATLPESDDRGLGLSLLALAAIVALISVRTLRTKRT